MRRYETHSTMMTSNRPLTDWGKLIGDVPSATAILDRFLHHAEVLTFSGKSYRLRKPSSASSSEPETELAPGAESSGIPNAAEAKPAISPTGSAAGSNAKTN